MLDAVFVLIILLTAGGYLVSAFLHPFRPCRSCGGSGAHRGAVYRKMTRDCAHCAGRGRFRRSGAPRAGRAFGESRRR